jgi:hypothetical protein
MVRRQHHYGSDTSAENKSNFIDWKIKREEAHYKLTITLNYSIAFGDSRAKS